LSSNRRQRRSTIAPYRALSASTSSACLTLLVEHRGEANLLLDAVTYWSIGTVDHGEQNAHPGERDE
jgi:hypothetical protein